MLAWIGLALLSASWLFGLDYYSHVTPAWILGPEYAYLPDRLPWALMVVAGTLCLISKAPWMPGRWASLAGAALAAPAAVVAPWPYRAGVLLVAGGLLAATAFGPSRWLRRLGRAASLAGTALLAQGATLMVYTAATARSHELPWPLPGLIGRVASLLGIDVGVYETTVAMFSMRETHMVGATWELLLDPVTLSFLVGGVVYLAWMHGIRGSQQGASGSVPEPASGNATEGVPYRLWLGAAAVLAALVALWLPLRAALLGAFYLHDVLRTEYEMPLDAVKLLWNPWVHLAALAMPVLLAWRFVPRHGAASLGSGLLENKEPLPRVWRYPACAALVAVAACCLTAAVCWDPPGVRQAGRVVVEEFHPQPDKVWERTDKPFDTTWYGHLSGYNYYCIYDYLSHYYSTSRLTKPIDDKAFERCDVLVLKVPTRRYALDEIETMRRFVERGGGLLLIGEHTNVFGTGTYLNEVARRFGFQFRYDCLFGIDSVFEQQLAQQLVPHPVLQYVPAMDFATSCSIAPLGRGRAVIRSTGLKNKLADYHVENFYPLATDTASMRYGSFVQLWSTRYGRGRVLGFTDSTIFSNFCTFEPGKAELMLGMIEWLNRRGPPLDPRPWLLLAGTVFMLAGVGAGRPWQRTWAVLLGAGLLGWSGAVLAVSTAHRAAMPPPLPIRPMTRVVIDRTLSDVPWPKNGFIAGKDGEFGIFERWILRLGYFTSRREGSEALQGDLVIIVHPSKPGPAGFREDLLRYVAAGGKVLVIDSPENRSSTANDLLAPLGISLDRSRAYRGTLRSHLGWPAVPVASATPVRGGRALAWLGTIPVAAAASHGRGSVTVLGFGSRFSDLQMGVIGDVVPDDDLKKVYQVEFSLLRWILQEKEEKLKKR